MLSHPMATEPNAVNHRSYAAFCPKNGVPGYQKQAQKPPILTKNDPFLPHFDLFVSRVSINPLQSIS
jgi:hypothetical protein